MCILCGALGFERYWAEKGRDAPLQRRERRIRIRLLNRVLCHYGVEAKLWGGGGYVVGKGTGPTQLVDNLSSLWVEVERASGKRCDPLDAALIQSLNVEKIAQS